MSEADVVKVPLTRAQFYWRAVPTFVLLAVWTVVFTLFAGMTGGFGDLGHGYLATLFLIHMGCIDLFAFSVLAMLLSLKWAIRAQWCLAIADGILWLASGGQDPLISHTIFLIPVPLLGNWILGLKSDLAPKDQLTSL